MIDDAWRHEGTAGYQVGLAFSPDGRRLASCGFDEGVVVWDVESGRAIQRVQVTSGGNSPQAVTFDPSGALIWSGANAVGAWNISTGKRAHTLGRRETEAQTIVFDPAGTRIAVADALGVRVFARDGLTRVGTITVGGEQQVVTGAAFASAARVAVSTPHAVALFAVGEKEASRFIELAHEQPTLCAVGDTGRLALLASPTSVEIWSDDLTQRLAKVRIAEDPEQPRLVSSPDGGLLASSRDAGVEVIDTSDARVICRSTKIDARAFALGPKGSLAVIDGDGVIRVFDARTLAPRGGHAPVRSANAKVANTSKGAKAKLQGATKGKKAKLEGATKGKKAKAASAAKGADSKAPKDTTPATARKEVPVLTAKNRGRVLSAALVEAGVKFRLDKTGGTLRFYVGKNKPNVKKAVEVFRNHGLDFRDILGSQHNVGLGGLVLDKGAP